MGSKMAHLVADLGCNKGQLTLFVKLFLSGFQKNCKEITIYMELFCIFAR